jgi:acyl-CoA synthetase (NDP forming)
MIRSLVRRALDEGRSTLTEGESMSVLGHIGIATVPQAPASSPSEALQAAQSLGYPVVLKAVAPDLIHKSERGALRLDINGEDELRNAFHQLAASVPEMEGVLVQAMLTGRREFVLGAVRDPQFGPCVMFGIGGVFAEIFDDVVFRVAPLDERDADEMLDGLRARALLDAVRGLPAVDRAALRRALIGLGRVLLEHDEIAEIDINPVVVVEGDPIAVDAAVVVREISEHERTPRVAPSPSAEHDLARLFNPSTVAVIGVAREGFSYGRGLVISLLQMGFSGTVYPINPKGGEIAGLEILKRVEDTPEPIDLAIIAVPAAAVADALAACRARGAAGAVVLSAGFSESGTPEGVELERRLADAARGGIRIIGPNCFGIYRPHNGLSFPPSCDLSRQPGNVAFISQSGGMAIDFATIGRWIGVRFSTMVSFGNGCDLRETELLSYFGRDPETEIITAYLEGVEDGRAFFETLREVAAAKPVLVCKGGVSDAGARAAASHTASMAGRSDLWMAALEQCNAVAVRELGELADATLAFSMLPRRVYRGLSVVGGGGGLGVRAVDLAEELGFLVPTFPPELAAAIGKLLPQPGSGATNPVDTANPYLPPKALQESLELAGSYAEVDLQVAILQLYHYGSLSKLLETALAELLPVEAYVEALRAARESTGKPILVVLPNLRREREALEIEDLIRQVRAGCVAEGLPVYEGVARALRAAAAVSRFSSRQ